MATALDLGLHLGSAALSGGGAPSWAPEGALAYGDFINNRYFLAGSVVARATFLAYTRSGTFGDLGNAAGDIGTYGPNVPRLNDRGLLIEPAVQNDNQRSNAYANAQWTNTGVDISAPAVGGFTPVTELAPSTLHRLFKGTGINVANGATKSFIWTLKKRVRRYVWMRIIPDGATSKNVGFDLDTVATTFVSSGFTASISKVGSTYFAIVTFTTGTTSISTSLGLSDVAITSDTLPSAYPGSATQVIDSYNLDCIDGSVLRSPIITDTVAVQRPADAYSTTFMGSGSHPVVFTFDNDTKDVIEGVSAGTYAYPTNLSRPIVKSIAWGDVSASERIVGTNGRGNMVLLGTSSTLTTFETREPFYIGVDTPYIQLAFDNWGIASTGADILPPTDITISAVAIEKASATSPVLFSGSRSVVIAPGETRLSDRLYASNFGLSRFTRGDLIWVRKRGTVPTNGQMFDGAQVAAYSANGCFATRFDATVGSNNVSQVDATGAMTAKTGQADFGAGINTTCILGLPLDLRIPIIYAQGTSIDQASIDAGVSTLLGGAGWIMRAMFDTGNTKPFPVLNHARPSSSLGNGMSLTRRSFYYRYASVAIDGHGTGDIQQSGAGDITTFKANELTQWAAFRAAGIEKIIKPKVIPRNQSSDLWATLVNQSQTTAFDTKAQDVNDWIDAQLSAGLIDHALSQNVARYDTGSNYWKWPVNGVAKYACEDGTHPVNTIHALMAADLRALLGQMYPYAV